MQDLQKDVLDFIVWMAHTSPQFQAVIQMI